MLMANINRDKPIVSGGGGGGGGWGELGPNSLVYTSAGRSQGAPLASEL